MKKLPAVSGTLSANSGFTLIEVIITIGIFLILTTGIYFTFANLVDVIGRTRTRTLATSLLNKEVEIIRNLGYDDVGIIGGAPAGQILGSKQVSYEGQTFVVDAYVRNIDNPFDGTLGGSPGDSAPADYKLVHLTVTCTTCFNFVPTSFTTWVAPQNLESSTQNGALFVSVFDANGQPVSGAGVQVSNSSTSPTIYISDTTNASGILQLVDIPTSTVSYRINIVKTGYSTSQTWTPGGSSNPNPVQPHATVASQAITAISFAIDRLSTLNLRTQNSLCQAVPAVPVQQIGNRLVGTGPNVPAYSMIHTTDSSGNKTVSTVPWDTYSFTNLSTTYDLAGASAALPMTIDANTTRSLSLLLEPHTTSSLLVSVANASGTQIADAQVSISKTGFNETKYTGQTAIEFTDWSGSSYASQSGNIDTTVAGTMTLAGSPGSYSTTTSWLISNTIDFGTTTQTLRTLSFSPTTQPSQAGSNSLRFQLAANNDNSTWTYTGPDGTGSTYYSATSTLSTQYDGNQYLRYKVYMSTLDAGYTPTLNDVQFGFTSGCVPSGSAFWGGLSTGTYTATIFKTGYTLATSSVVVGTGWQEAKITLQ